jgi:hypothetical protein
MAASRTRTGRISNSARSTQFSGRLWYRSNHEWEMQASSGHLKSLEALEPGNIVRSTASFAWTRKNGAAISSMAAAYGRNDTNHGPTCVVRRGIASCRREHDLRPFRSAPSGDGAPPDGYGRRWSSGQGHGSDLRLPLSAACATSSRGVDLKAESARTSPSTMCPAHCSP